MASDHFSAVDSQASSVSDVPGLAHELHMQLQRYIEAQYPIRHPAVVAERHALEALDFVRHGGGE